MYWRGPFRESYLEIIVFLAINLMQTPSLHPRRLKVLPAVAKGLMRLAFAGGHCLDRIDLLRQETDEKTEDAGKLQSRVTATWDRVRSHWSGGFPQSDGITDVKDARRRTTTSSSPGNDTPRRHEGRKKP